MSLFAKVLLARSAVRATPVFIYVLLSSFLSGGWEMPEKPASKAKSSTENRYRQALEGLDGSLSELRTAVLFERPQWEQRQLADEVNFRTETLRLLTRSLSLPPVPLSSFPDSLLTRPTEKIVVIRSITQMQNDLRHFQYEQQNQ